MTRAFSVDGENEKGYGIVDFCVEREMYFMNIFWHMGIHKYTLSALRNNMERRSMIDFMQMRENMMKDVYDMKTVRGMGWRYMII